MAVAETTQTDPWQLCFDTLGTLPSEVLNELDAAWQSLAEYQVLLDLWHEQLCNEQARLTQLLISCPVTPIVGLVDVITTVAAPPAALEKTVRSAAQQFAALRRQCQGNRPTP